MKKIPRSFYWIIMFFILSFWTERLIFLFPSYVSRVLDFLNIFPKVRLFSILFFLQELFLIIFLIISIKISFWKETSVWIYLKSKFKWLGLKKLFWYAVFWYIVYTVVLSAILLLSSALNVDFPWFHWTQQVATVLDSLDKTWILNIVLISFTTVILAPLVEELIYRWYIADVLIKDCGRDIGIVSSAFIFAAIHMDFDVLWILFILALILSYIYSKTNSIRYSLAFHMLVNGISILFLFLR